MAGRKGIPGWLAGLIGAAAIIAIWWIFSLVLAPRPGTTYTPVPSPWEVFGTMIADGFAAYWRFFSVTLTEAGIGFLWGNGLALLLASTVLLLPRLETVITQIAVVSYCLPIVAVGGIAIITLGGAKSAGEPSATAIFLAALTVFFTTVVGALLGFKAADKASLDVIRVLGGGRFTQLRKVRLVAALPAILSALQIAVPTSLLGAVLGEYMGKTDLSVGTMLIRVQGNLDSVRAWGIFIACAIVALIGYGIVGLVSRFITPWLSGRAAA